MLSRWEETFGTVGLARLQLCSVFKQNAEVQGFCKDTFRRVFVHSYVSKISKENVKDQYLNMIPYFLQQH